MRRADHSSRGVLSTVVRRCVWSRNLVNEDAMAPWWGGGKLSCQKQTKTDHFICLLGWNLVWKICPFSAPDNVWFLLKNGAGKSHKSPMAVNKITFSLVPWTPKTFWQFGMTWYILRTVSWCTSLTIQLPCVSGGANATWFFGYYNILRWLCVSFYGFGMIQQNLPITVIFAAVNVRTLHMSQYII